MVLAFWICAALAAFCLTAGQKEIEKCPTDCPKLPVQPVCDNTGRIYTNKCNLLLVACKLNNTITEVDWLDCEFSDCADAPCYLLLDPICGSDGKIYSNDCMLLMASCGKTVPVTSAENCDSSKSS